MKIKKGELRDHPKGTRLLRRCRRFMKRRASRQNRRINVSKLTFE